MPGNKDIIMEGEIIENNNVKIGKMLIGEVLTIQSLYKEVSGGYSS